MKLSEKEVLNKFSDWWPRLAGCASEGILYHSKSGWRLDVIDDKETPCTLEFSGSEPTLFAFTAKNPTYRKLIVPGIEKAASREEALGIILQSPTPRIPRKRK